MWFNKHQAEWNNYIPKLLAKHLLAQPKTQSAFITARAHCCSFCLAILCDTQVLCSWVTPSQAEPCLHCCLGSFCPRCRAYIYLCWTSCSSCWCYLPMLWDLFQWSIFLLVHLSLVLFRVICKLHNYALSSVIQTVYKAIERYWTQFCPLKNCPCVQLPVQLWATNYYPWSLTGQFSTFGPIHLLPVCQQGCCGSQSASIHDIHRKYLWD